jgi:hypothetical protein
MKVKDLSTTWLFGRPKLTLQTNGFTPDERRALEQLGRATRNYVSFSAPGQHFTWLLKKPITGKEDTVTVKPADIAEDYPKPDLAAFNKFVGELRTRFADVVQFEKDTGAAELQRSFPVEE